VSDSGMNYGENYFSHKIVPIWNNLPKSLVYAESVNNFKPRLDKL